MQCPCFYPDFEPGLDPETEPCDCGHLLDEHDEDGQCEVEIEDEGV